MVNILGVKNLKEKQAMYKFETKTNENGEIENVINHNPEGWNPSTGIYAPSYIFQGDWEDELKALDFTRRGDKFKEVSKIFKSF